ncbi:hypothetical protein TrVE_jg13447 [Triparma verrucosa]|uniref:Uncharacterized protein n=1 Tax=Triparma verrucosa TaxID=1606542 RepID=A0A9W7FD15_9STRA|nr:hypothetical protein TrVE_jg13447 [Triparma verrucosa]
MEELDGEEMLAPRDLLWISETRFLLANFFSHSVTEFDFQGNFIGVFAEVTEPEGMAYIPDLKQVAVTSYDTGLIYFFDLNAGKDDGHLQISDAASVVDLSSLSAAASDPMSLAYDTVNKEMLCATWHSKIVRFCVPGLPCTSNRQGIIAKDANHIEDIEFSPPSSSSGGARFMVSCTEDDAYYQFSVCECPIPDESLSGHSPYFLIDGCRRLILPEKHQYDIGNGYWDPGGLTIDHERGLLYVLDSSYSRVFVFTMSTLSYLGRLEEKSGYLSMPTELAVRPGIVPSLSSFNLTSGKTVVAGEQIDMALTLRDKLGDEILVYELVSSSVEIASFSATVSGEIQIRDEEIDVSISASPAKLNFKTGVVGLNFTLYSMSTYQLRVFQRLTDTSLHELSNSPLDINVVAGATDILSSDIEVYRDDGEESTEVMAGKFTAVAFSPRDVYGNPSGMRGEEFMLDVYVDDGDAFVLYKSFPFIWSADYDYENDVAYNDDDGGDDDGDDDGDDEYDGYDDDEERRRGLSGLAPKDDDPEILAPYMVRFKAQTAEEHELNVRLRKETPKRNMKYVIDVIAGEIDVSSTPCWIENHLVQGGGKIAVLEFDSSTNDLSLVVRAEPVDRYGNSVFYTEEDLTIGVIMEDGDVASHILEPPNYDEIFVVKKGVAVSFEVAFYYDGEPMIDSMVQVNVKNVGTSTISTQALLVTVLSSIATIIVIFVCFRRFVFKSDTSTLKSEATEIKENIAAIGFDLFDVASDVINFTTLARHCAKYALFYQVFLGTAGISAIVVICINLKQIKQLMVTGNAIEDSEPCISLRKDLVKWKMGQIEGGNAAELETEKLKTTQNIQLKHRVTKMAVSGSLSTIRATVQSKKSNMLQILDERLELMREKLIIKRKLERAKVGIIVVFFEDLPLTLLNIFIMINGCDPDDEDSKVLPFFFLLTTVMTTFLGTRRFEYFLDIRTKNRRMIQIQELIEYKTEEATQFSESGYLGSDSNSNEGSKGV